MDNSSTGYNQPMPPPRKAQKDKREEFVKVYLTASEKARLSKLAKAQGLSLAGYVRMILVNVASSAQALESKG